MIKEDLSWGDKHITIYRWCIIKLYIWNLCKFINQCHANTFNKGKKRQKNLRHYLRLLKIYIHFDHWYLKFKNSVSAVLLPFYKDENIFLWFSLSLLVTSSKGQLCVCTAWVMWEGCSLAPMLTGKVPTTSGCLFKEESPTHDQEL